MCLKPRRTESPLWLIQSLEEAEETSEMKTVSLPARPPPPVFRANKPFLYFIVDKLTRIIIFAGKVTNPDTLKIYQHVAPGLATLRRLEWKGRVG
ncbi:hypothetical protein NQ318_008024 [Aromia moschata]|uniref:Serpin domain-containing protein n=1 Tax=Aromia moschata TaxID=1265417 RepID=A0AAV8XJW9_9CUCU|nr:hypothetical protein NQ318_008024 [Aromia moschata]